MRNVLRVSLTLLAISALWGTSAPQSFGNGRAFGIITGSVKDSKGNPLGGAVISLLREGANEIVKEVRSAADGSFTTRITPGRYSVRASANGYTEALFSAVQVRPADELIYRFNLQPVGSGRTAPERRKDRDSTKWGLRANQGRRSVFQIQEGEDETVNAALNAEEAANSRPDDTIFDEPRTGEGKGTRVQGVVETYAATSANALAPTTIGMNFAVSAPATQNVDLIFAGQMGAGTGAPQRLETTARIRAGERHTLSMNLSGARLPVMMSSGEMTTRTLGQVSVRAIDEWVVRDSIVIVLGLDYSRFVGASNARSISPRIGLQFDANARTRVRAAYAPGGDEALIQSAAAFEDSQINFRQPVAQPVALVDGRAVMERSRRFEFGVERVLDNESSIEATAFFDTTSGRGVGLMSMPINAFSNENGTALMNVANQQGAARGMRVVYTRRISNVLNASAGYSFGRGQRLSSEGLTNPSDLFSNGFFQTAAFQLGVDLPTGTRVRTVFRFSPGATIFAIDPFAGRLAVYDPSLSIMVTQELPTFGLPVRAEAVIDARNLLDVQASAEDGETKTVVNALRRSVRGGISVRF
jgi:hypothetical protein